MIEVDDSELTPEYQAFINEWANALGVPVPVLLARLIVATIDGQLYVEKIPGLLPLITDGIGNARFSVMSGSGFRIAIDNNVELKF